VLVVSGPGWRFSHATYAVCLLLGLAATVGISRVSGQWRAKPQMVAFTNAAGKLDAEQMRGWMTLAEIGDGFGIPVDMLYQRAGLPRHVDSSTRVNQITRTYDLDFEPEQIREVVRGFLAGENAKSKGEKKTGTAKKDGDHQEEVKGVMTLNEVVGKTGVPKDFILRRVGAPADTDPRKPIREWIHGQGKSMQDVRDAIAAYRSGER
jgi:hypothetical protein